MTNAIFTCTTVLIMLCGLSAASYSPTRADILSGKVENTPLMQEPKNVEKFETTATLVEENNGCGPNVCFALDGSASIPPEDYELQKNFVQLVAAIVGGDPNAMFAAAQYGVELEVIKLLTGNAKGFLLGVTQSTFKAAFDTFIEPGVVFCTHQLNKQPGEPKKIVILGDGRSRIFDTQFTSESVSDFKNSFYGNDACAIGVGQKNDAKLAQIVGANRVFKVTDWPAVLNILDDLVKEICGI